MICYCHNHGVDGLTKHLTLPVTAKYIWYCSAYIALFLWCSPACSFTSSCQTQSSCRALSSAPRHHTRYWRD